MLAHEVDLVLNTSESEGICGSIVEAFFLKVPVLARGIPSNWELACGGNSAFIFQNAQEFKEHYVTLFSNEEKRKQKVEAAWQFAHSVLSPEHEKSMYLQVIQSTLA